MTSLLTDIRGRIATVTLNRPEVHNAFDDALIGELTEILNRLNQTESVQVIVLTGAGQSFSAGADLNWMRGMASATEQENRDDSLKLAELMRTLAYLDKTTVARVNGAAFGGGVGLIACCDIAIASDRARFGLTEARLGLLPAVISPYVIDAIGARQARRYFRTAERFDASEAKRIGLVHDCVAEETLDSAIDRLSSQLLAGGPQALSKAGLLIQRVCGRTQDEQRQLDQDTAQLIAALRVSKEGQEGLSAFLDKRNANWIEHD